MSTTVTVDVSVTGWDESDYHRLGGPVRLAQAEWPTEYSGGLTGAGSVRALLTYTAGDPDDAASLEADWVGYERLTGTLEGRDGSFVLRVTGDHSGGKVHATGEIVPDSGTGDLAGITGTAKYEVSGMKYPMELTYQLR